VVGVSEQFGHERPVRLAWPDRLRHLYVIGQTGTGKSTLLLRQILDDIEAGAGVCVLDPHGDLYHDVLTRIPSSRAADVVLIDPSDTDFPVGLNPLQCETIDQQYFVAQALVDIILRLIEDEFGQEGLSWAGPAFQQHVKMNLLLLMSNPERPASLLDFYQMFQHKDYWKRWVSPAIRDPLLLSWIETVLPKWDYQKQGEGGGGISWGGYVTSKFERFLFDPTLRNIFGQRSCTIDLPRVLDDGKILLVNLAKGGLNDGTSRFFGMVLLAMLLAAVLTRANQTKSERRPFYLYVDEFQSVATSSFIALLSEGRKFGIGLTLANQFLSQVKDRRIVDAIFGNVGSLVAFRTGPQDAEILERRLLPVFTRADLVKLPNFHASVSLSFQNRILEPFSIQTQAVAAATDPAVAEEIVARSRVRCARPKADAEQDVTTTLVEYLREGSVSKS
jgi:hypothetical protein